MSGARKAVSQIAIVSRETFAIWPTRLFDFGGFWRGDEKICAAADFFALAKTGQTAYTEREREGGGLIGRALSPFVKKVGATMRSRNYITTYSGHAVSPLEPDAAVIDIRDIAHALARIGRANGHFVDFYSVGQHCLDCAQEALARGYGPRQALACLLHDASEAYLSDITSPVKKSLRQYVAVEDRLLDVIYQKYLPGGVRPREQRVLKEIDNAMLYHEFVHFMGQRLAQEEPQLASEPCFGFTSFWSVEKQYLFLFDQLSRQLTGEGERHSWQTVGITAVDGGWQGAVLSDGGCRLMTADSLWELCRACEDADSVLTDLPVGLPESPADEALRPEHALRKRFGIGAAVVPCRQAVYADTDQSAREENIRVLGRTLSAQQLAVRPKLREIDELLAEHTQWKNVLLQSHPRLLGASRPLALRQYGDSLPQGRGKHSCEDALCLAVIGQMACRGQCGTLPQAAANDARGIRMQLVAPKTVG